jgi:hypothetical protein
MLCGSKFIAQKTTTKFCSHRCGARAYKLRLSRTKAVLNGDPHNQRNELAVTNHQGLSLQEVIF